MRDEDKAVIKAMAYVVGGIFGLAFLLAFILGLPPAYYQSKITGYSFWECFFAGSTVKIAILKEDRNGKH